MKIAIAGAGVAGSYLACLLKKRGHHVEVFEWSKIENHWPICAWAIPKQTLLKFCNQAELNFEDYVLFQGNGVQMKHPNNNTEHLNFTGLITFDKAKWEKDLLKDIAITYGRRCTLADFPLDEYDYVVDCTGVQRSLLPKSNEDFLIPTFEYLVEDVPQLNKFHIINYKNASGYLWYFPLGGGRGYIGAGDTNKRYSGIKEFFEQHPSAKIIKKIGRPLRLTPPERMQPFFCKNIIGVGESIGCVFPITGEGIGPSLICSDIFIHTLDKNQSRFDFQYYRTRVLNVFAFYDAVYRILRLATGGKLDRFMTGQQDLKLLFRNEPKASLFIKEVASRIEILSGITMASQMLTYPIKNCEDLCEEIRNRHIPNDETLMNLENRSQIIPSNYFPISNKEDLELLCMKLLQTFFTGMGPKRI